MIYEVVRRCNYYASGTFQDVGLLDKGGQVDILDKKRGYNKGIWGTFEKDGASYDVPIRAHGLDNLKVKEAKNGKSTKRPGKGAAGRDSK